MRDKACSRRGTLATACVRWRRALPLVTAMIMLLPVGVASAAQPVGRPAVTGSTYSVSQPVTGSPPRAETGHRCLVRCIDPEKPQPGGLLHQGTTRARAVVQEAPAEVREAPQGVREAVREAAGRVDEAAGEVEEGVGEVQGAAGDPQETFAEVQEATGEVTESLLESSPPAETAGSEPAPTAPPSEAAAADPQLAAADPTRPTELTPIAAQALAAPPSAATTVSAPSVSAGAPSAPLSSPPAPRPAAQEDPSAPAAVGRADSAVGGPNASGPRPEPGTLGQRKDPDPAVLPAPPAVAAPVAVQAPPIAPPDDAPIDRVPPTPPQVGWANWSMPLAAAGGLLAGLGLVFPMARRRGPANTAPNARLDGSRVPYLTPVRSRADDQSNPWRDTAGRTPPRRSTNVAGF